MKYLIIFSFLFFYSCGDSAQRIDANGVPPSQEQVKKTDKKDLKKLKIVKQDRPNKKIITTDANLVPSDKENANNSDKIIRGTFMYYADAATFKECNTGKKFAVSGDAYLGLEKDYLKLRSKDFQEIYVELKGEIKNLSGMEEGSTKATIIAKELIKIDIEKACN